MRIGAIVLASSLMSATAAIAAVDIDALWDFSNPALSEQRFRTALETARGDDALVLTTQIARTHGLRRDFDKARELLKTIEPQVATAGVEARTRHALELGRTLISATHRPEQRTPEALSEARAAYGHALTTAKAGGLDGLAVDAAHMMAFVDNAPADQLKWDLEALALIEASSQAAAKAWEPSIRNNLGMAFHQLARYGEALDQFQRALALREKGGNVRSIRIAHWMVAWTLRSLGRLDEAIAVQTRLESEWQAASTPDPYVFEELEHLYRAKGEGARAATYAERLAASRRPTSPKP